MINVSSWSIKNPIPGVLLFIMLTAIGAMSFRAMKIQNFPDIDLPTVTVTAALPGASPSQLETDVARKIENQIATLQGVKHIYTSVQDGVSTTTVEFRLEKPTQEAVDDVRDAVSRVRSDLPAELRDPIISRFDLAGSPILTYTVASTRMDDEALSWFVDDTVTRALLAVRGVGAVTRVGGATREVRVELDPARLLALNATAADISRQLRQTQRESSGGRTDVGGAEQSVRTIATVQSAAELAQMEIALGDGRRIRLDQVARVSDTVAEQRSAAYLNGQPVVGFEIVRTRGAGEVEVEHGVRAALETLKKAHPDITITEAFNFVDPVEENYHGSMALLFEGAALAVLVVFLFLRDWRATLVASTALPLSIIPAFWAMSLLGFTLNGVTLLALSLVVGILVDDAIVEIENIMRHLGMGKKPYQAAMEAADEIGLAVIATTFTLIAVFLPTAFMSGVPGKFFVQFGWTAAIAVFFSLVVARMLTPMMSAYILQGAEEAARRRALDRDLPRLDALVPAPPRQDDDRRADLLLRLARPRAAAADRLHPARRPLADAGADRAAAGRELRADQCHRGSGAPDRRQEPVRQADLHDRRRRRDRRRPVHGRRQRRGEKGDADAQPDAARRARRRQEAGRSSSSCATPSSPCRGRASTSASAARTRSTRSSSPARTAPCSPTRRAASSRSCARSTASATSPRPRAWCGRS